MVTDSAAKPSPTSDFGEVFVDVALPVPLRATYTYRHSDVESCPIQTGSRVIVPFGKRQMTGYCVAVHDDLDEAFAIDESKIKDVVEVVDEEPLLTPEILELTRWAAGYYESSWGEMLKGSLPAGINALIEPTFKRTGKPAPERMPGIDELILKAVSDAGELTRKELEKSFGGKSVKDVTTALLSSGHIKRSHRISRDRIKPLTRKYARLVASDADTSNASQRRVIDCLKNHPEGVVMSELLKTAGVSISPVKTLNRKGIVEIFAKEIDRDPLEGATLPDTTDHVLTSLQANALKEIERAIDDGEFRTFLIHGVTGSGKTEIYIRAIKKVLSNGETALMMVPEIALTPVFSKQLRSVFGKLVAILHSSLSAGERYDEWRRIRSGDARVVIGTRSAVFAPLQDIGLIVVDEEHDTSYRQHEMPFYNGRDTAIVRAKNAGAVVILGSATPSLESYRNAKTGKYTCIEIPQRVTGRPLPEAKLVDMRNLEQNTSTDALLSPPLHDAITEAHEKGEQSMILLNRRGYSQFVLCRSCGDTVKCRNCEITLTFHRTKQRLICHYCGFRTAVPEICPGCESRFLFFLGEGTEKIEEILVKTFPEIRIARVDRDTMRRKRELERVLESFEKHETDMLVGTQMIAKGHDFPNVTLVGVISVDAGLSMPEFRSAERTFQLLTQVAGRAGRGQRRGRVLIQTFHPDHYALQHALSQDYNAFYQKEIEFRRRLHYPPFVAMAQVMFKHPKFDTAFRHARIMFAALKKSDKHNACITLGPAPAPLSRLKGEFRVQVLIKSKNRRFLKETIEISLAEAQVAGCDLRRASVEIDPVNLL